MTHLSVGWQGKIFGWKMFLTLFCCGTLSKGLPYLYIHGRWWGTISSLNVGTWIRMLICIKLQSTVRSFHPFRSVIPFLRRGSSRKLKHFFIQAPFFRSNLWEPFLIFVCFVLKSDPLNRTDKNFLPVKRYPSNPKQKPKKWNRSF